MKDKLTIKQAAELFSSHKKVFKLLDKTLSKQDYEFLIKAEQNGSYAIYSQAQQSPIVVDGDVLKACMGLLYFEYGVGKQDSMPTWSMPRGYVEDKWQQIISQVETPQSPVLNGLNKFLDTGSSVYLSGSSNSSDVTVVLTNNFTDNLANRVYIKADSFSDGLHQANDMANYYLKTFEDCQQ